MDKQNKEIKHSATTAFRTHASVLITILYTRVSLT